eukprot:TRINITY_DN8800_c1_g1_i1.p1 TRINITY_DN8800_c1_g1~~TRINITY_DN8800_c1_g1_i1.p1  ORF type:complete len:170 (+),score=59.34 TRINITY_DN8800_c1_g1_i1:145-654(+)
MPTEDFSLGVTGLLEELLAAEKAKEEGPSREEEAALRKTFQRTAQICGEVQAYYDLVAKDKADAEREAAEKQLQAAKRLALNETMNSTCSSLYEALEANEAHLEKVRDNILEELQRRGSEDARRDVPALDFEALLAECDEMQATTHRFRGIMQTPQGWRRLDPEELAKA